MRSDRCNPGCGPVLQHRNPRHTSPPCFWGTTDRWHPGRECRNTTELFPGIAAALPAGKIHVAAAKTSACRLKSGSRLPLTDVRGGAARAACHQSPKFAGSPTAAIISERVSKIMKNQCIHEFSGDRLISKREAAGILGVSIRTLERAISHGSISIRKIRGCVRLLLSEVLLFGGIQSS